MLHFLTLCLMPLCFQERPTLVSVFAKGKSIFIFTVKGKKAKTVCSVCSAASSKNGTAKILPQELHSAPQHQACIDLKGVCEHLTFISTYLISVSKMCHKVSASSLTILAYDICDGHALLSESGGNVY